MKKIICTPSQRLQLIEKYRCSQSTVSEALNFRRDAKSHREMRSYAVNILGALPVFI